MVAVSGFVVGFERTEYSVEEGSDVISVCLRVELRNILEPTQASVEISTEDRTATSKYIDISELHMNVFFLIYPLCRY